MIHNERFKILMFTIYTLIYEMLVWGLVSGAIYFHNWNEWTVLVGIIMSVSQLKPKHFGLPYKIKEEDK